MSTCICPVGTHIAALGGTSCKSSFGQIQKILFMRRESAAGTPNEIDADDIIVKTEMTSLISSSTGTKITVSPFIQNPTFEPGAARTWGSGNQVLGGVPKVLGTDPTKFTGTLLEEGQSVIKALKTYSCEDIGVMFVNESGDILAIKKTVTTTSGSETVTTTSYLPIPIKSFFVGDLKVGGFEEPDSNAIEFNLDPNWSDETAVVKQSTMNYNPLTDLVNAD